jgi:small-conductance mechanosensitive channel
LIFGWILEKVVLNRVRKLALLSKWQADNVVTESLRHMPLTWCFFAGAYGALLASPARITHFESLKNVLVILFILSVTAFVARIAGGFLELYGRKQEGILPAATILKNLARIFIFILGTLTIFHTFGVNITPALTALGVGGLAVALALQDTLSNFFSGLQIIASKQISPGDYVQLESGQEGYVTDITWRYTTLHTLPNNRVIVPNSKLASNLVTNYHLPDKEIAVLVQACVAYGADLPKVEKVTIAVAKEVMLEVPGGVPDFEPFIRFHTFGDFSINFSVILRGKEYVDQHLIKHEFIRRLHARYEEEKIKIPYPIRTIFLA